MSSLRFVPAAALVLAAAPALAQQPGPARQLLVTTGASYGVDASAFDDIAEESAWLAEDFGGFVVTRWYQLGDYVAPAVEQATLGCGSDVSCYVDNLFDSPFEYVLVVNAFDENGTIAVDYQMIDTRVGIQAAITEAYMPSPTEFAYLAAPCHDALKVTPEWIAPPPPPPVTVATPAPAPPPPIVEPPRERNLGQIGRAGAYTAGLGGAAFVTGVLLGFGADETQQEIQAEPHPRRELESLQAKGQRQQRMANVLMVVGGVAAASGVAMVIVDRTRDDQPAYTLGTDGRVVWLRADF